MPSRNKAVEQWQTVRQAVGKVIDGQDRDVGTAWFHRSGLFVTVDHVISAARGEVCVSTEVHGLIHTLVLLRDEQLDLAVLVSVGQAPEKALTINANLALNHGQPVNIWGYSRACGSAAPLLIQGVVSGFQRSLRGEMNVKTWIINAGGGPGFSGSPVLDINGDVIGTITGNPKQLLDSQKRLLEAIKTVEAGAPYETPPELGEGHVRFGEVVAYLLEDISDRATPPLSLAVTGPEINHFLMKANAIRKNLKP